MAKDQYLSGIEVWASNERPISTTCLCFLSTRPFCWEVDKQDTLCRITDLHKVLVIETPLPNQFETL